MNPAAGAPGDRLPTRTEPPAPPGAARRREHAPAGRPGGPARGPSRTGLFTRRYGPPLGTRSPTVVLVHGLGLSGRYFVPLARRLAANGATVLVPDLPGNGRSRAAVRRAPDIEQLSDALAHWHEEHRAGPAVLVANSVGCQVVAALAARPSPWVRGVVLIGPALEPRVPARHHLGRLLADAPREPLSLLALATADYLTTGPARFLQSFRRAARDADASFEEHLRRVDVPALVARGVGDTVAHADWARRVARLVRDGRSADVPGAAHAAHYSAPDAVAALIRTFAEEAERADDL
ncbi:alpha/beta fold hydrolase [Streptomyces sp. NPDC088745]|uniref:alpha/beta fold hydrolase n=1 Tax=Streptomyces sp. NPDC088745 TaxID=3365884 RepID=UPI0037F75536